MKIYRPLALGILCRFWILMQDYTGFSLCRKLLRDKRYMGVCLRFESYSGVEQKKNKLDGPIST